MCYRCRTSLCFFSKYSKVYSITGLHPSYVGNHMLYHIHVSNKYLIYVARGIIEINVILENGRHLPLTLFWLQKLTITFIFAEGTTRVWWARMARWYGSLCWSASSRSPSSSWSSSAPIAILEQLHFIPNHKIPDASQEAKDWIRRQWRWVFHRSWSWLMRKGYRCILSAQKYVYLSTYICRHLLMCNEATLDWESSRDVGIYCVLSFFGSSCDILFVIFWNYKSNGPHLVWFLKVAWCKSHPLKVIQ